MFEPLLNNPFGAGLFALALVLASLAGHALAWRILGRLAGRGAGPSAVADAPAAPATGVADGALGRARGPSRMAAVLLALEMARFVLPLPDALRATVLNLLALCWVAAGAWLLLALGELLARWLNRVYSARDADNLAARKVLTQVRVFQRLYSVAVCVLALAVMLMHFDSTRGIGASVLASAGIAGAVAGLSAQKFLSTVIAGVQLALTQPIRLDDVVVVDGHWGRVEEITMTYVVVRVWDERRLVLPVSRFLDKSFENWTRTSADIMGTVFLRVDWRVDVEPLRAELERICREDAGDLWDGRVCGLQVTDAGPAGLELRALVSSAGSSRNWDLRCLVREKLAAFLRERQPQALPRTRLITHLENHPGTTGDMHDETRGQHG